MEENLSKIQNQSKPLSLAWSLAWSLGYTITIPLVVLTLGGRLLDHKLGTSPWLLITGVVLAVFISTIAVYYKATQILASSLEESKKKSERDDSFLKNKKTPGLRP